MDVGTPGEKTMSYSYNALGQQVSYSDYFGGIAASAYNSRGWLLSKAGAEYAYNANGTVESASFGDNSQGYTYDNRLQTLTNTIKNSLQTTLYSESNTFNNAGNMTESVTAFADTLSNTKTLAHTYGYDIFGQLTGEQYKQSGITLYENAFDYDFSGNLAELNDETFGANDKNQLISTAHPSENTTLVYDDNGNLLSRSYLDENEQIICTETYDYDVWGQMVESDVGGLVATYTYYPDGLRKTKTVGEETTQYYYDGDVVVNETLNGQWSASNVKALGNRIVKRTTEDGENALMYNSRGDVVMILAWEDSAEPVAAYLYLAYGKLYSDLSDFYGAATLYDPYVFDCPILYAGQYYDHETGLYYLRARYYSPDLCRFISEDPIKDGLNWYAYCAGNPVMFYDPWGYQREPGYYTIDGVYGWYDDPDASEFDVESDTYKIINDLSNRWFATSDQAERDRLHGVAEDARRLHRAGTPYMYGNDIVIDTLHANAAEGQKMTEAAQLTIRYGGGGAIIIGVYSWFVNMTCTKWDYKENPYWQVKGKMINGVEMFNGWVLDEDNNRNWRPWIYFEGDVWGADQIGNINLAYVGYKMGYGQTFLTDNLVTRDSGRDGLALDMGFNLARDGR